MFFRLDLELWGVAVRSSPSWRCGEEVLRVLLRGVMTAAGSMLERRGEKTLEKVLLKTGNKDDGSPLSPFPSFSSSSEEFCSPAILRIDEKEDNQ